MSGNGKPFVVAVDARVVFDEVPRGIAKSVIGLYRALAEVRPGWRFRLFHQDGVNDNPFADLPNVSAERIDIRGDRFRLWEVVRLPAAVWSAGADVFHAPAGPAPRFVPAPVATTIHDLIPLETRATEPDVRRWGRQVRRTAAAARVILTPSEHSRQRIAHHFGLPAERVTVVRWGPVSAPGPARPADLPARYGVAAGQRYVLHFGMADPRKNTARVIDSWAGVPADPAGGPVLVVVGVEPAAVPGFVTRAKAAGVADRVRVHGYAPEADIRGLLAGAVALCYPTLYEGFGLPILDAFAADVPVVAGGGTSVPEVTGDAAEVVDPTDPRAIAGGVARVLGDPGRRAELVARGRDRLARFDWRATAELVAGVFERAARRPAHGRLG